VHRSESPPCDPADGDRPLHVRLITATQRAVDAISDYKSSVINDQGAKRRRRH
jgi:hypothetical protein